MKMLDIHTEEDYLARFGGYVYCFLRGLEQGADGIFFDRPSWDVILKWEEGLIVRAV